MEKHTFSDLSKAFGVNNLLTRCKKGDDWKTLAITHFQTMGVIVLYNGFNKQNICVDPEMVPYERIFSQGNDFSPYNCAYLSKRPYVHFTDGRSMLVVFHI
uniref:Uncharacterized protein n=1 Tax=Cacopsylla melanoneura TaxID=428564 RepID=A0A8D9F0E8_9HEMI